MRVLLVTFPPVPPLDAAGLPVNAIRWNVYESNLLIGTASPTDPTFESPEVTAIRTYSVTVSLVNAVGEGPKSDPRTVALAPITPGRPLKPGVPGVTVKVKP